MDTWVQFCDRPFNSPTVMVVERFTGALFTAHLGAKPGVYEVSVRILLATFFGFFFVGLLLSEYLSWLMNSVPTRDA